MEGDMSMINNLSEAAAVHHNHQSMTRRDVKSKITKACLGCQRSHLSCVEGLGIKIV